MIVHDKLLVSVQSDVRQYATDKRQVVNMCPSPAKGYFIGWSNVHRYPPGRDFVSLIPLQTRWAHSSVKDRVRRACVIILSFGYNNYTSVQVLEQSPRTLGLFNQPRGSPLNRI